MSALRSQAASWLYNALHLEAGVLGISIRAITR
jgi:hypothetical protein